MRRINRRDSLKVIGAAVAAPAIGRSAVAAPAPLPPLTVSDRDAELLRPGSQAYKDALTSSNRRAMKAPQLRALCKTPNGVATMVNWARDNRLPFALRAGGHSYEGFSASDSVVIDVRNMKDVTFDCVQQTMTVGAGAALGPIYDKIGKANFGFPGGSCPTVGVTGHALGGGYGMIARSFGLACDSLQWVELVDAKGDIVEASATQNPDLFWALRGGGGGSFGAVTRLRFKIYPVDHIVRLFVSWPSLTRTNAVKLMQAWQAWAPNAPKTITTNMHINSAAKGAVAMLCSGQSTGSADDLLREVRHLTDLVAPHAPAEIIKGSFRDAVVAFSGVKHFTGTWPYLPSYYKAKSDYVKTPLSADGIATLMSEVVQRPGTGAICDCYGGAIADVAPDASAFAHRAGTLFSIQYYKYYAGASQEPAVLATMKGLYQAMRPYVSGSAYFNYCDLDLGEDYAQAYWGANLPRLRQIKKAFDPDNVFQHQQSVRPA